MSRKNRRWCCKFPSVSTTGFAECTCVSRPCLSCCRLSSCRVVELVGPPTAFPRTAPRVPWVSFLDPRGCQSPDDPVGKSQPLCVLVGVVTSCVLCARVRGRVSRSCATENTYRPARLEAVFSPFSDICVVRPKISAVFRFGCSVQLVEMFLLVVASRLVHANANLFLSR